jgi:serine/threonine protein kinase
MSHSQTDVLPTGTVVHERYKVVSVVGRGGLGTVYYVTDVLFGRNNAYALKELIDQSRSARRQFEQESQWLQALDHNHIPKVREYFEWAQRLYLVMDFVDGENLEQKLVRAGGIPLSEQQVVAWILPICDALQYLHSRMPPILHRDVKPANIIVTPANHPVLVDLGIAKEHLPGANQTATFVRKAGTEGYAPPEQYSTAGKTGPWSDVYALGATMYQLLTGRMPPTAVERVALDARLVHPREINVLVSEMVDGAIYKALAIRPGDRFQNVQEFARALRDPAALNASSRPASPPQPISSPPPPVSSYPSPPRAASVPSMTPSSVPMPASAQNPWATPARAPVQAPPPPRSRPPVTPPRPLATPLAPPRVNAPPLVQTDPAMREHFSTPQLPPIEPEKSSGRRPTMPYLLGGGLLIVVVAVALIGINIVRAMTPPDRSSPNATVTGYYAALQAQDYTRAWQFASASRNDTGSQSNFVASLQSDDQHAGKVTNVRIVHIETDNSGHADAVVQVTRANSPSTPQQLTIVLTQYDGTNWLIDSIAAS